MNEKFKFPEKSKEAIEQKKERLLTIFAKSLEVMQNQELELEDGILMVTRKCADRTKEKIADLLVIEITADGPNLAHVFSDGTFSASATILWSELLDVELQFG